MGSKRERGGRDRVGKKQRGREIEKKRGWASVKECRALNECAIAGAAALSPVDMRVGGGAGGLTA